MGEAIGLDAGGVEKGLSRSIGTEASETAASTTTFKANALAELIANSITLSDKSITGLTCGASIDTFCSSFLLVLLSLANRADSTMLTKGFPFTWLFDLFGVMAMDSSSARSSPLPCGLRLMRSLGPFRSGFLSFIF